MNALFDQFVAEARELIQQSNDDLIAAERDGFTEARIDRVFRAFHTLKGSAGVVELPAMALILHAAEDVLAAIQAGRTGPTGTMIDQLLVCLDLVSKWVDVFDLNQALPADAGDVARQMSRGLRGLIGIVATDRQLSTSSASLDVQPDWVADLVASQRPLQHSETAATPHFAFSYRPRAGCFFDGDDPIELVRRVPKLKALRIESLHGSRALAEFDPFACELRLEGITTATQAELAEIFRLVPDQVDIFQIPVGILFAESSSPGDDETTLVRSIIQEQAEILRRSGRPETFDGRVGSAIRVTVNALRYSRHFDAVKSIEQAGDAAIAQRSTEPLVKTIGEVVQSRLPSVESSSDGPRRGDAHSNQSASRAVGRSLRVSETRIDALVDLAGELLVVTHGVAHLARRAEEGESGRDLVRAIKERKEALERIAGEVHGAVLRLRMVAVAQVFRSFPRIVRDLSQQLGKDATLVILGETTESDKTIVDLMFEPLMHLVRNALDHGIETSDQRRMAGKSVPARITLQARPMGDRLVVDVVDDGRGIDPSMIRRKALEKGLMSGDELSGLSDEQVANLVFSAGFSTASQISDISGRGVGMDVVRETIEQIGGRLSLRSEVGIGTTVSLDFPMNIALLRIMVVETAGQLLGIPMDAVLETVRLAPDRIRRFKNNDSFVLHDRVVPICSLGELLNLPSGTARQDERLVVVAEIGGRTTALEVDAVRERMEVVLKPMQGLLSQARGYAGTTLLGDGGVLLVLDLKEILP